MGVKKGNRTGTPTLTRVRIVMVDSNASFAGVISTAFLAAVRISMLMFNTVVVAELDSGLGVGSQTAQCSKVDMLRDCGGWSRWRIENRQLGNTVYTCPLLRSAQESSSEVTPG